MAEAVRGSNRRGCGVSGSTRGRPALVSGSLPRTPNPDGSSPRAGANSLHGRRHTSLGEGPAAPQEPDTCPCASGKGRSKGRCERGGGTPGAEGARPAAPGRGALLQAEGPGRSRYLSTSCSSRSSGSQSESGSGSRPVDPGPATPWVANPQRATTARTRGPSRRLRVPAMLTELLSARNAATPEAGGRDRKWRGGTRK